MSQRCTSGSVLDWRESQLVSLNHATFNATMPVAVFADDGVGVAPLFSGVLRMTVPFVSETAPMLMVVVAPRVMMAPMDTEPDVLAPDLLETVCSAEAKVVDDE